MARNRQTALGDAVNKLDVAWQALRAAEKALEDAGEHGEWAEKVRVMRYEAQGLAGIVSDVYVAENAR